MKISNLCEIRILKILLEKFVKFKWDLEFLALMSTNFDEFFAFREILIFFLLNLLSHLTCQNWILWQKFDISNCVFKTRPAKEKKPTLEIKLKIQRIFVYISELISVPSWNCLNFHHCQEQLFHHVNKNRENNKKNRQNCLLIF